MSLSNIQVGAWNVLGGPTFYPGKASFVSSGTGSDSGNDGSYETPYATIDYAIGKCTASKGDVIYVLPGHAETLTAAGGITADIAGISIIGLGEGSLRPTITMGTATSVTVLVTAANVTFDNMIFIGNLDNIVTCFYVQSTDCTIKRCEFRDVANNKHFLVCVKTLNTASACNGLRVLGCKRFGLAAAAEAFISILESFGRCEFSYNDVCDAGATGDIGHFATLAAMDLTNFKCVHNTLALNAATAVSGGIFITGSGTAGTGVIAHNLVGSLDTSAVLFDTATLPFFCFENYVTGVVAASGVLWPAADTVS